MDFREARFKVLRSETMTNIWYTDTEGYLMPKGVPNFGSIDAASVKYWGWTGDIGGTAACRVGQQSLGAQVLSSWAGTGAQLIFNPITFPSVPLTVGSVSLWTKIGGNQYAWHDSDGNKTTFTDITHIMGTGGAGPYAFTSKAKALVTGSVTVKWVTGGITKTITDDGAGSFVGATVSAGTVNYDTGAISITFAAGNFPDNNTPIQLSGTTDTTYDVFFQENIGVGDGTSVVFSTTLEQKRLLPGSVLLSYLILGTVYYAVDDGAGNLVDLYGVHVQAGSVINYTTGAITLILGSAPDTSTAVESFYSKAGLIRSVLDYATGDTSVEFAAGYAPDNGATVFSIGSHLTHSDFAGIDVVTGICLINQAGKRIHFRDARGYLDSASEGFDDSVYPHYCKPGDIFSLAAYVRRINGAVAGYLRIRFWDGTSAYTQISAGSTPWDDISKFSGDFSIVDDPYNPGTDIYQFEVTADTRHDKLTAAFKIPTGARAFSVEFETDTTGTQEGDQIFSLSGLYLSQGTTAFSYSPPAEVVYLPRPISQGKPGQILAWESFGRSKWIDPSTVGVAAIAVLNGLTAAVQTLTIGTAGLAPSIASAINNHTVNIPLASAAGVTAGLVANAAWTNWQNMAAGTFNQVANPNIFSQTVRANATNTQDLGTSAVKWRTLYAENVYADTQLRVGGATNYGTVSVVGTELVFGRSGAVVTANMTAFTSVTASLFQANRLYALGTSDIVHLEVKGNAVQTSNLFNIENTGASQYFRANNSLTISHLGRYELTNSTAGSVGFFVRAAVGQSTNLFEIQSSGGTAVNYSDSVGSWYTQICAPRTDNTYTLGTSALCWSSVYATNYRFKGSNNYITSTAGLLTIYTNTGEDIGIQEGLAPYGTPCHYLTSSIGLFHFAAQLSTSGDILPGDTGLYVLGSNSLKWLSAHITTLTSTVVIATELRLNATTGYINFQGPGGVWSDSYYKCYYRVGTLDAAGEASFVHGLNETKIIGMHGMVVNGSGVYLAFPYYFSATAYCTCSVDAANMMLKAGTQHYSFGYKLLVYYRA